jgi:hypothetical protein
MSTADTDSMSSDQARDGSTSWLLQLPDAALVVVLQQLDPCSLANTALACTAHSHAVPSNLSTVAVSCKRPETLHSLAHWFDRHRTNLGHIRSCSLESTVGHYAQMRCGSYLALGCKGSSCSCSQLLTGQGCWGSAQP